MSLIRMKKQEVWMSEQGKLQKDVFFMRKFHGLDLFIYAFEIFISKHVKLKTCKYYKEQGGIEYWNCFRTVAVRIPRRVMGCK